MTTQRIIVADALDGLRGLPDASVHVAVTSPPYWGLRDYGVSGQIGLEKTPAEFVARMVEVFREVRRVLRDDASCWINLGDSYANSGCGGGSVFDNGKTDGRAFHESDLPGGREATRRKYDHGLKPKDLVGIPWQVAFALRADGWYLRQDIVWHKPAPMPESVRDRCTKAHEYIFLLTKRARYYYDQHGVAEPLARPDEAERKTPAVFGGADKWTEAQKMSRLHSGNEYAGTPTGTRNLRSVWTMASQGFSEAHFATFPIELPERCIRAGTSLKGCCPTCGAPWRRVVESVPYVPEVVDVGVRSVDASRGDKTRKLSGKEYNEQAKSQTTGWKPTCDHGGEPVPCTVLDPFCGAATTLLAAQRLGRNGIGIELNPEYAAMAERRLRGDAPLLSNVV